VLERRVTKAVGYALMVIVWERRVMKRRRAAIGFIYYYRPGVRPRKLKVRNAQGTP
jgi:hypothetical protein